ncbi:MAG TPA: hypothetical protein VE011_10310 [Candidatus Dormibacteraeota bacterium]|nr:hypothetical protein [Candidatus Dormibacteraeota bacterium]
MAAETVIAILGATLLATGALLATMPVGTCSECAHCRAERVAREREAEARVGRFYGIPICRTCGRHHVPEEGHHR